jgi:ectoine hydroxylase-related dioxygenase (phytanoyl-CoA dioxygenase family)
MQFAFVLEDTDEMNGCTVVIPGSHQSGEYTDRDMKKRLPVTAKAGDLICWDSRLWHGTLPNKSNRSRWVLMATLGMWWIKPSMDITRNLPEKIYSGLTNRQKVLLGYCSIPPINEFERTNTKCGHDFIKPTVSDYYN